MKQAKTLSSAELKRVLAANTMIEVYVGCQVLLGDLPIDTDRYDPDVSLDKFCDRVIREVRDAMVSIWTSRDIAPRVVFMMDRGYRLFGESMAPNVKVFDGVECCCDQASIEEVENIISEVLSMRENWLSEYQEGGAVQRLPRRYPLLETGANLSPLLPQSSAGRRTRQVA